MNRKPLVVLLAAILLVPAVATAASGNVRFTVRIDGTSELNLSGSNAWWHHLSWDPPGTTTINGVPWNPTGMSTHCGCDSDTFTGVVPAIPHDATSFTLTVHDGRGAVNIVQYPNAGNGYVLTIRIDDEAEGGDDAYDVTLAWASPEPIPASSRAGLLLFCILLAGAGVWLIRR